ncbi:hypothetical protein WCX18_05210 [Sulfurimonas sp. HSL1-2]|uniref:hypothetical protein n=1 Tax=Thiomicrolovo zhangzhouensis TaxID=3131933 RepID=UPI0031F9D71F
MLNLEQILIKAAQYLDLDLNRLAIKQTPQKRRFIARDNLKEKYDEVLQNLLQEIYYFNAHPVLKDIVYEFLEDYEYVQRELYSTYNQSLEKKYDWLLLKHFVVPYFAYLLGRYFSQYADRIDKGLPGGEFWYLPKIKNKKIIFPLNMVLNWWIDLYGGTNEDFYAAMPLENSRQETSSENFASDFKEMDQRRNVLKSWHDKFVIPDMSSIHKYASEKLNYQGLFIRHTDKSLEEQFEDACTFVKDVKTLTLDDLKREFPNPNNLLGRLEENLEAPEKEKFVSYVHDRWQEPMSKQLSSILTSVRVIQSAYKYLSNYFESDMKSPDIEQNRILQLCGLFSKVHNLTSEYYYGDSIENLNPYALYYKDYVACFFENENKKEMLDRIISYISKEVGQDNFHYSVDELLLFGPEIANVNLQAAQRLSEKKARIESEKADEKRLLEVLFAIQGSQDGAFIDLQLKSLENFHSVVNLGECFEGNNFLTNEFVFPNLHLAMKAYYHAFAIAQSDFERTYAAIAIINLATSPFHPRLLKKEEVDYWFEQCTGCDDMGMERDYLIHLTQKAFHEILQKKHQNAVPMIVEFMNKTRRLKDNEYRPELLCVGEKVAKLLKNRKLEQELKKRNAHHKPCKVYIYASINYY